jgi:hypothetical protein
MQNHFEIFAVSKMVKIFLVFMEPNILQLEFETTESDQYFHSVFL